MFYDTRLAVPCFTQFVVTGIGESRTYVNLGDILNHLIEKSWRDPQCGILNACRNARIKNRTRSHGPFICTGYFVDNLETRVRFNKRDSENRSTILGSNVCTSGGNKFCNISLRDMWCIICDRESCSFSYFGISLIFFSFFFFFSLMTRKIYKYFDFSTG